MEDRVKKVLATVINMDPNDVSDSTSVDSVESWDSMRHMTVIIALEEEFSIEFGADEVTELLDYKSLCHAVQGKLG